MSLGTWYKFRQILESLLANLADYILFIDCDAFIMLRQVSCNHHDDASIPRLHRSKTAFRQDHDPVARMVETMNSREVDIMVADEDWRGAKGATNTGVVLVRNCNWTRTFFKDILDMQVNNVCKTNEQACFRSLVARDYNQAKKHVLVDSGLKWNRHPQDRRDPKNVLVDWDTNPNTEIVHFMGGAKSGLERIDVPDNGVCEVRDAVAVPSCIDVEHCSLVDSRQRGGTQPGKFAYVMVEPLHKPPGQRFLDIAEIRAALEAANESASTDVVFIVPQAGVAPYPLTGAERTVLQSHRLVIRETTWITPPGATATFSSCGPRGGLSLHAFGLSDYAAVAVLGPNMVARHSASALFGCGAREAAPRFLHAGHPQPRLAAFRPNPRLLVALSNFASTIQPISLTTKESDCGLAVMGKLLCTEAGSQSATAALQGAGASPSQCTPIDPCKWGRDLTIDGACSKVNLPCTYSHVAAADSCPLL